jgi:hypothetical protein
MNTAITEHTTFSDRSIEQVREYWNRRPCNLRHSPEPVGTRAYFDQVEARKYFVEPHIPGLESAGSRLRPRDGYDEFCARGRAGDRR